MIVTYLSKIHKNIFPAAHCQDNFRLLSETLLRVDFSEISFTDS